MAQRHKHADLTATFFGKNEIFSISISLLFGREIRVIYTRQNKSRLKEDTTYIRREFDHLYEPAQVFLFSTRLIFVPFTFILRFMQVATYFVSFKWPYCDYIDYFKIFHCNFALIRQALKSQTLDFALLTAVEPETSRTQSENHTML